MTAEPGPPAVELRDVGKRFADHVAVDDVSLAIAPGEFFSLLGPSGCGKTTTLRLIAGFEMPTAGTVHLNGTDITAVPPHLRRVGMVFQHYALFPHLTVFENVAFALRLRRTPDADVRHRVTQALEMVRLPGLAFRRPAQLSGGQQQRIALARALVFRPAVVLLDEPLGALDLKLRKTMQLELKTLQREVGVTFVYVTHDQEEALTMSDRIAVMDRARVLQVGDPRTIYERPVSRFVADFIGSSNFLTGHVRAIAGTQATIELGGVGVLRADAAADLTVGQTVTVAVRPERLRLARPDAPAARGPEWAENEVAGVITNVVYTGSDTQYFVALGAAGEVMARLPNDSPAGESQRAFKASERVVLRWDVASTAVLVV
ncbi:MAG: ABC transporter ATP-binding protein [Gemmatimonadales bacterium]